jgi:hypothetical protein
MTWRRSWPARGSGGGGGEGGRSSERVTHEQRLPSAAKSPEPSVAQPGNRSDSGSDDENRKLSEGEWDKRLAESFANQIAAARTSANLRRMLSREDGEAFDGVHFFP